MGRTGGKCRAGKEASSSSYYTRRPSSRHDCVMITRSRGNPKLFTEFGAKQGKMTCPECYGIKVCPASMELRKYFVPFFAIGLTFFAPIGRAQLAAWRVRQAEGSSADQGIKIYRSVEPSTQEKIFITWNEK